MPRRRSALALATSLGLAATLVVPAGAASAVEPRQQAAQPAAAPVIVTEILADNVGGDEFEYFEIRNTTGAPLDLAAAGITFAYGYSDTAEGDSRDRALALESPLVLAADETAVLWLSYTNATGTVDAFARTPDEFRATFGMDAATTLVRVTGQAGMANGGDRSIRVLQNGAAVSWSYYPGGSMAPDQSTHFRLPADAADPGLDVLAALAAPSPGVVAPEALVPAEPGTGPDPLPVPGTGPAASWPLLVTEIAPDNTGVDDYEYFEVYNPSAEPVDLQAQGVGFAYTYVDSADRARDVPLRVDAPTVIAPGETVVFWLSYTAGNVDAFARTEADFRAAWGAGDDVRVVRATGQPGMANTAGRGIRIVRNDEVVNWSFYRTGEVAVGQSAHFRIPGDTAARAMPLLEGPAAPTPGVVAAAALAQPPFDPQPDPSVQTAPLQITELLPDSRTNVNGSDGYEFIEVYNATSSDIDFSDYSIDYLYPDTGASALWPATPSDVVIPGGGTLVFWIKNAGNAALGEADFNREFGTELRMGEDLVEIQSAGMANGGARGIQVVTNTGRSQSLVSYNRSSAVDDTVPDQGIRFGLGADSAAPRQLLDLAPATPGVVQRDQVPAGLMIVPADTVAPTIEDLTADGIAPGADFPLSFRLPDDVRTATLTLANDVDAAPLTINLRDAGAGVYTASVSAVDLIGKSWFEYSLAVTDGTNRAELGPVRLSVRADEAGPVRLNLEDGAFVSGTTDVIAGGDAYPTDTRIAVDGETLPTLPSLEARPVFAFEVTGVNFYFKNGIRIGEDVLRIFQDPINDWETLATPVPLSYVRQGDELVVRVWAGSKKAPEIDLGENNDDFSIRNLRLVLPDGRTLTPAGYDDPARVLQMGDSAGKLDFYDARFTLPDDAFSAVAANWDTTTRADGPVDVIAERGADSLTRSVVVDNTAPVVTSRIVDGSAYQGEIVVDAEVVDEGSGVASTVATLDGTAITLPYTTSSVTLPAGEHVLSVTATDMLGNATTWEARFTTFEEQPTGGILAPAEGDEVEAGDVSLSATVEDPTADTLDVSFREGRRVDLAAGEIATSSGLVNDALDTARTEPVVVSGEQLRTLEAADGVSADLSSTAEFPYQLFDIAVGADAGTGAQVRATWSGRANAGATVLLYVMRADGSGWDEVTRYVSTADDQQFTLTGMVDADAYAVDGKLRMLVQHSEGFSGGDLSTRDTPVTPVNPGDTPRSEYDFTIGWLSDTQYYNENAVPGEDRYRHQTAMNRFLLDQREAMNLQYVTHTGDIIDDWDQEYQWQNADAAYRMFDQANLPYGLVAGNHDVGSEKADYSEYTKWFGADRYQGKPWIGGTYQDNRARYDLISAGGIDFLILYQGWAPGGDEIAWMNEVLAKYPDRTAIIVQHEFILTTGGLGATPQRIMDEVVAPNPNVRLMLAGHYHDAFTRTDQFDDDGDGTNDRTVYSMLFDYQGLPEGGQGFLRLLQFDNQGERLVVRTYSPSLDQYDSTDPTLADAPQDFEVPYADLGIQPRTRTLSTDAFAAEILTTKEIAAFSGVASGSVLTATWPVAEVGARGWYVRTGDPYGAVDYSPVSMFSVIPASEPQNPGGENPGGENPGGETPGGGDPGSDGGTPGGGGSGQVGAGGSAADSRGGLATTGSDAADFLPWTIGGLVLALGGGVLLLVRRRRRPTDDA